MFTYIENTHAYVLSHVSHVWLFATLWKAACQVPLSRGFSRQEYWSGVFFLLQGTFPDPGSNLHLMSFALAGEFFTTSAS